MAEIIAANFRTDAQKLALSEKCLHSLSPRTLPVAASMCETNAEAKAGMQKQRPKRRRRNPPKKTKTDAKTQHEICDNSCPGGHLPLFLMIVGGLGASGANLGKRDQKGAKKLSRLCSFRETAFVNFGEKWVSKNVLFLGPPFFRQKWLQGPQKEYSGGSGSQKVPKMEPNIDTFWELWTVVFCCYL